MPICITCSTPVKNLYTTYSRADDRSLGKGVRLTQCPNCKRFADKYVEHDYVVMFIDLVLIKPQVYRHLLFNRLWTPNDALDPSIIRLGILLVLFDVYITWARIERTNSPTSTSAPSSTTNKISSAPIITQYLFFLTLNIVATIVQHGITRTLARILVKPRQDTVVQSGSPRLQNGNGLHHFRSSSSPVKLRSAQHAAAGQPMVPSTPVMTASASTTALDETTPRQSLSHIQGNAAQTTSQQQSEPLSGLGIEPRTQMRHTGPAGQASPSAISTALFVSSCTKLFPILLVIWPTSGGAGQSPGDETDSSSLAPFAHRATSYIGWIVLLNNIEALLILLQCGYVAATTLAVAGLLSRWVVEGWILTAAGLVRELEGPIGDVISVCRWITGAG